MRLLGRIAVGLFAVVLVAAIVLYGLGSGWFGEPEPAGEVTEAPVPRALVDERREVQALAARAAGVEEQKQILFGDLHVHTTFSFDAFLMSLPVLGGEGTHPPADACDFARYCSALDFWSINDHAENITHDLWQKTVDSVRQCNAVAGDPANPDLVTYLGWEWSQIGRTPDSHYGHKNVVFLGTDDDAIPARPIGAYSPGFAGRGRSPFRTVFPTIMALLNGERGRDFAYLLHRTASTPRCPEGVPVRELPLDCLEQTETPEQLFEKLRDWDLDSIVIPHGTAWGMYTPAGSSWDKQLAGHDPDLQRLVEVYSGHGASEVYRSWRATEIGDDGSLRCPEPTDDYLPSCWRAGELIEGRCLEVGESETECARRAAKARQDYVEAWQGGWYTARGHGPATWLDSGQCRDCFQPTFNYRPAGSAQYMLAVREFDANGEPKGFEFGFMGSSDNHGARPGTGYKEFWRGEMTEGRGQDPDGGPPAILRPSLPEPLSESIPFDPETGPRALGLFETERGASFFVTGGLIAAHSAGRDRRSIWNAMHRREVYATSGPRILLWFDLLNGGVGDKPMGSKVGQAGTPRFRVRAVGSFEQKPGCPDYAVSSLAPERLARLCRGDCYHPSDRRRTITRIEVVRVRPQVQPDEPLRGLIEDPWLTFACPPNPAGCSVEFEDPDFEASGRDATYYVRAIEEPSLAIHGSNPMRCRYDENGRCAEVALCSVRTPREDDCLSETEPRAWSSPIFVRYSEEP